MEERRKKKEKGGDSEEEVYRKKTREEGKRGQEVLSHLDFRATWRWGVWGRS